jgi:hypothetical protein
MKKIMFKYLDSLYPEIYLFDLDFSKGGWFDQKKEIIEELILMFSVTRVTADMVLDEWVWNRPKYKPVYE